MAVRKDVWVVLGEHARINFLKLLLTSIVEGTYGGLSKEGEKNSEKFSFNPPTRTTSHNITEMG